MAFTERISAACGRKKAELVLKHAKIINVFTESIEDGDVAVEDGVIVGIGEYDGVREIDVHGCYVAPGLIDGHIHLESSMASPKEFARMVVPHGTAAVITDPHEIANVAGTAGCIHDPLSVNFTQCYIVSAGEADVLVRHIGGVAQNGCDRNPCIIGGRDTLVDCVTADGEDQDRVYLRGDQRGDIS